MKLNELRDLIKQTVRDYERIVNKFKIIHKIDYQKGDERKEIYFNSFGLFENESNIIEDLEKFTKMVDKHDSDIMMLCSNYTRIYGETIKSLTFLKNKYSKVNNIDV